MRVFNEEKTAELKDYDLENGYLKLDKLFIKHHEKVFASEGIFHYEVIKTYQNGGRDLKIVWDEKPTKEKEAYDEYENIQVYVPFNEEEKKEYLRKKREKECYLIINRGELWYKRLTDEQKIELDIWYQAWLDAPQTMVIPEKPVWLK